MSKILPVLVLVSFLAILVVPLAVSAAPPYAPAEECKLRYDFNWLHDDCDLNAVVKVETFGMCCLMNSIHTISNWVFVILIVVATIFIVIAGFTFVTAAGDPAKVTTARNYVLYALIGLVVAFLAKAILGVARMVIGT